MTKIFPQVKPHWEKFAFGQHYWHLINRYDVPACRTRAIRWANPNKDYHIQYERPKTYNVCTTCTKIQNKVNKN